MFGYFVMILILKTPCFSMEEVTDAKWVTLSELENMFNDGLVVPSLGYYKDLFNEKVRNH